MKTKFLAVITGIIIILTSLSGCSCSSMTILEFNHNFYGTESNLPSNYTEVCEYDVYLDDEGVNSSIKDNLPKISGKLVTTFESSSTMKDKLKNLLKDTPSDLLDDANTRGVDVYRFATDFSVSVQHECIKSDNNIEGINYDTIKTEVYFFSQGASYAPIYTTTSYNYTSFAINEENSACAVIFSKCSTLYQKNKYTLTESYAQNQADLDKEKNISTKTINYTYKTLVDNAQLLFLVRNMDVLKDTNSYLPTVSYQYDEAKELMFMNLGSNATGADFSVDYTLNQNLINCNKSILKTIAFKINSQYNSGALQSFSVQEKEATETEGSLPFKSLLYKYEKPLLEYSSNTSIGTLVHELKKVEITDK